MMVAIFVTFIRFGGIHSKCHPEKREKHPCYLPEGKAEDTPSPSLPKVRSKLLRLHLWRLRSAASSTFATLGFSYQYHAADQHQPTTAALRPFV
jgi:hypothetical protein